MSWLDLAAYALADRRVEVGEWLVEEDKLRFRGQRPRQRDTLLLTAGELVRHTLLESRHPDEIKQLRDPPRFVGAFRQAEADVGRDAEVGEEGEVLEDMATRRFSGARKLLGPLKTRPSSSISPASGASKPAMSRSSVVLPQPLGPSSASTSPCRTARSAPLTAAIASKRLATARQARKGLIAVTAPGPASGRRRRPTARRGQAKARPPARRRPRSSPPRYRSPASRSR